MPVHRQKKCTAPKPTDSTQGQTSPTLPDQQDFQQHVRELARGAIRVVLEGMMREELDALIGKSWGESSPDRKGYRNGSSPREPCDFLWSARGVAGAARPGALPPRRPAGGESDSPRCLLLVRVRDIRRRSGPNPDGSGSKSPAPSAGSTAISSSTSPPGASVVRKSIGVSSTWMASISMCFKGSRPIRP
jgi:hypothetical protein